MALARRAPRPAGTSVAQGEREASWSAERSSALAGRHALSPNSMWQQMCWNARTGGVNLTAKIDRTTESGNGFASENMIQANFWKGF